MPTPVVEPLVLTVAGAISSQILRTRYNNSSVIDFAQYPNINVISGNVDLTPLENRVTILENDPHILFQTLPPLP